MSNIKAFYEEPVFEVIGLSEEDMIITSPVTTETEEKPTPEFPVNN